ncbi:MAG: hypothetical protein LBG17_09185 [Bacteroidales bacterium]|jgi:hypothetical protein|nr:hypothetical protein [Bacteroidales bacterium]
MVIDNIFTLMNWSISIAECNNDIDFYFGDSIVKNTNVLTYTISDNKTNEKHDMKYVYIYKEDSITSAFGVKFDGIFPLRLLSDKGIIKINQNENRIEFVDKIDSTATLYPFSISNNHQIIKFPISFADSSGKRYSYTLNASPDMGYNNELLLFNSKRTKSIWQVLEHIYGKNENIVVKNIELGINKDHKRTCSMEKRYDKGYPEDLLLGFNMLSNYNIYFDYKSQNIALEPITLKRQQIKNGFTAILKVLKGKYIQTVSFVDKENCAFDLLAGDELYRIGECVVDDKKVSEIRMLLSDMPNTITVKRNNTYIVLERKKG